MLKILVADDHALVRAGICKILTHELGEVSLGEAGSCSEVLVLVRQRDWDLLLLDITLPGRSGMEVLGEVKTLRPSLPVLVVSMHSEEQFAIRALKAGAAGYVPKEKAPEELVQAVKKALSGRLYVSEALAEKLAGERASGQSVLPHESLSNREFEVLMRLAAGRTVSDIAEELGISAKTVSTYRARILEKLSLGSNAELAQYALRHGLIQ